MPWYRLPEFYRRNREAMIARNGGKILDEKGFAKMTRLAQDAWQVYHEFGNRVENINRTAMYEQLVKKGYSHQEANFAARDLLDFQLTGRMPVVRFLTSTVPFMNARIQSLRAMTSTAQDNPRKFALAVAPVIAASLGLMLAQQDDPWWKEREDFDRDSYWCVKIGDRAYYIPKPFELGAIGTMAERTWELAFDKDMTMRKWGNNLSQTLLNTFSLDPVPQFVKPIISVYANKDPYTQRPIETDADQKMRPQDRYDENTTGVAKIISNLGFPNPMALSEAKYEPLSPKQVDYMLRAYLGPAAAMGASMMDTFTRPTDRPTPTLSTMSAGFVHDLPQDNSKYVEEFYQVHQRIEQAVQSFDHARQLGDVPRAREIQLEEQKDLALRPLAESTAKTMAALNRMVKRRMKSAI